MIIKFLLVTSLIAGHGVDSNLNKFLEYNPILFNSIVECNVSKDLLYKQIPIEDKKHPMINYKCVPTLVDK